jgi:uncharacterized protein with HEPN domain
MPQPLLCATSRITSTWPSALRRASITKLSESISAPFYAVTRCLEIISEASRRLPDGLKARHPAIAWKEMAAAGNIYRHDYENVAASYVWVTVQNHLPPLRTVVDQELAGRG